MKNTVSWTTVIVGSIILGLALFVILMHMGIDLF